VTKPKAQGPEPPRGAAARARLACEDILRQRKNVLIPRTLSVTICAFTVASLAGAVGLSSGCRTEATTSAQSAPESATSEIAWRRVGAWTGHGREQTESFESSSGSFRVKWQTKNEAPAGTGRFQLTLNSSISGRPLQVVVEQAGAQQDVAYVQEDPRVFFAVVDSINIDWSFTIEEAVTR
jgi:hypothetical protein